MDEKIKYCIVCGPSHRFQDSITNLLNEGWVPMGELKISPSPSDYTIYHQGMVKYPKINPEEFFKGHVA